MKKFIFTVFFALMLTNAHSQIKDVTFAVSPMGEYTWWNENLTLDNSTFWGGRVGFGFGPLFEIRGFYQKSFDVKASLRDLNWEVADNWADKMTNSHVDISRYGGEMKFNLMKSRVFAPYITLGGGVQNFSYDIPSVEDPAVILDMKEEQLFGALGFGTKFNLSDRIVLSLEAKNTFFNVNEKSYYLNPEYVFSEDGKNRLHNWSAVASLDFYFGGVKTDNDDISRAYDRLFSDGFRGMKFVLEPGGAYLNFHEESLFHDQYFLGGAAGVDFSSLVGLRAFYYQATEEPDKLSLNVNNDLSMYGGNIIARLNQPRGVNPYLNIGAGYLKVGDNYIDKTGLKAMKSAPFAFGGVGLEIPLSKYMALYGSFNAVFSVQDGEDVLTVQDPSQVKTSLMYQAGMRFNLGKAVDAGSAYSERIDRAVLEEREINNQRINDLRAEYENRIAELDNEIDLATASQDYTKAAQIIEERNNVETLLKKVDSVGVSESNLIRMTEEDLNRIVNEVINEVRRNAYDYYNYNQVPSQQASPQLNDRLDEIEQKLDRNIVEMNQLKNNQSRTTIISERDTSIPVVSAPARRGAGRVSGGSQFFKWNRVGVYTGPSFGDIATWNIGVRGYMQIGNTDMDFMPELYAAFGDKSGVGISGNVVYNINIPYKRFSPYFGLGLGVFHGKKVHYGTNIILGGDIAMFGGSIFADYSSRSWFKQNQIAVGYRFVF